MRLLYLDDSGSTNDPSQDYVVLGGICVSEAGVRWLTYEIEKIAVEICPSDPSSVEFHAAEIYAGKKFPWSNIPQKADRVEIIKRILHVLDPVSDPVFAVAVQKSAVPRDDPMLRAYEMISQSFNNHLEFDFNPPERGIVILDDTSYETGLQNLAIDIRRTGNRLGLQNRSIVEIPLFIDSKACRIVQLADHIAYAVFRRYNSEDISYFNIFQNQFVIKDGIVRSLLHLNNSATCTCPACLSRRTKDNIT